MKKNYLLIVLMILVPITNYGQWSNTSDNYTNGRLSLRNSGSAAGDIVSLYDNRLDNIDMYGFGVESSTIYYKSLGIHRWYINSNADGGLSTKMELNNSRLFVNTNIGIGTSSPDELLHIYKGNSGASAHSLSNLILESDGGNFLSLLTPNNQVSGIMFADPEGVYAGYLRYSHSDNEMSFYTNSAKRVIINNLGNVGIGTISPDYTLDVFGIIRAREIKVDLNGADFVFEKDYELISLTDLE